MKLLLAWPSERMAYPWIESNLSFRHLINTWGRRRVRHEWPLDIRTHWHRQRKSDRLPDIGRGVLTADLYVSARAIAQLFPDLPSHLEFLPFQIDGDEWAIIHPCRRAAGWSQATSDVDVLPVEDAQSEVSLSTIRWLTVVDPEPDKLDLFYVDGLSYGAPLLSESLVDRIQSLRLVGLDFTVVGEIVSDPSQASPAPPRPPPPPRRDTPSGKGPKLHLELLKPAESAMLAQERAALAGLDDDAALIEAEIATLKPLFASTDPADSDRFSAAFQRLHVRIGELVRRRFGWSWQAVVRGRSQRFVAVASPDGAFALSGGAVVMRQLQTGEPSLQLLLNLIGAGQLPPAQADRVVMLQ